MKLCRNHFTTQSHFPGVKCPIKPGSDYSHWPLSSQAGQTVSLVLQGDLSLRTCIDIQRSIYAGCIRWKMKAGGIKSRLLLTELPTRHYQKLHGCNCMYSLRLVWRRWWCLQSTTEDTQVCSESDFWGGSLAGSECSSRPVPQVLSLMSLTGLLLLNHTCPESTCLCVPSLLETLGSLSRGPAGSGECNSSLLVQQQPRE